MSLLCNIHLGACLSLYSPIFSVCLPEYKVYAQTNSCALSLLLDYAIHFLAFVLFLYALRIQFLIESLEWDLCFFICYTYEHPGAGIVFINKLVNFLLPISEFYKLGKLYRKEDSQSSEFMPKYRFYLVIFLFIRVLGQSMAYSKSQGLHMYVP